MSTGANTAGSEETAEETQSRPQPRGAAAIWSTILTSALSGAAAGLFALGFDVALARWMLGFPLLLKPLYFVAYLATGAALGLLTGLAFLLFRREARVGRVWAWSLLLTWAPPVLDRVAFHAGSLGLPSWLKAPQVLGPLAVLVLLAFAASLWGSRLPVSLLVLAGLAGTAGLAIHRNIVDVDFSLDSLHLDAGIVACAVLAFLALRSRGARRWIAAGLSAAIFVLVAAAARPDPLPERVAEPDADSTNLILIVVDTLRADVFRNVLESTPEGAAFRERFGHAALFDRLTAVAPWTVPSMGSVHTGLYPSEHGFGRLAREPARLRRLDEGVPTLAMRLRNRGYRTFAWIANPILYPKSGIDRGFDSYSLLQPATTKLPLLTLFHEIGLIDEELYQPANSLADRLEEALDDLAAAEPFFLWLHLMDPHDPYHRHEGLTPPVGDDFPGEDEALYYGEVRFTLARLAEMIDDLGAAGLWQDSAVVFLSDHGEMFESDNRQTGSKSRKGTILNTKHGNGLYEELVHVPLVIRPAGGLEDSTHIDRLVSHVDLYDTFADLLHLDLPPATDARRYSVAPWVRPGLGAGRPGPDEESRAWAISGYLQHQPPQKSLTGRQLKIIDFEGDRVELFDLENDPKEAHDLSAERPEALAEGLKLLESYWSAIEGDGSDENEGEAVELDEETRKRLEALGYL